MDKRQFVTKICQYDWHILGVKFHKTQYNN